MSESEKRGEPWDEMRLWDEREKARKPRQVFLGKTTYGTLLSERTPEGLVQQTGRDRIPLTALQIVALREAVYRLLCQKIPNLQGAARRVSNRKKVTDLQERTTWPIDPEDALIMGEVLATMRSDPGQFAIWMEDLMTSSCMATVGDQVYVGHGDFFDSHEQQIAALRGEVADGGVTYPEDVLRRIKESKSVSSFPLSAYADQARGGTYPIGEFTDHPHAITVLGAGIRTKAAKYLHMHQTLAELVNPGPDIISTWQTAKRHGFIRTMCMGGIGNPGKGVYPRNTATAWWHAIVVDKQFDDAAFLAAQRYDV